MRVQRGRPGRMRRLAWAGWMGVLVSLPLGCGPPPAERWRLLHGEPDVRVGLLVRGDNAQFDLLGDYELRLPGVEPVRLRNTSLRTASMHDRLVVWLEDGRELEAPQSMQLNPLLRESRFHLGEHRYRGSVRLLLVDGKLTVVNVLPLETYLCGVVPWEIGWRQEGESGAVEAQAIAARTYACKRLGQYEGEGYDLLSDVMDQVYRGTTREDSVANRAIRATRGLVVTEQATLIEAYYSSTCGGHTSRIEEVWDKPAAPYLVGGLDRVGKGPTLCSESKHFRWVEVWSGAALERTLQETLPREADWPAERPVGDLVDLRIAGRDSSGRAHTLEIETTQGTWTVRGDRIRWVLRPEGRTLLRSSLFTLQLDRHEGAIVRAVVRGGGNGHGVGMCQMGAIEMARRGYDRAAILSHYYPTTVLSSLY